MRRNRRFRRAVAQDDGMQELFDELGRLRAALADAYMRFNGATEPELVEACVYEINAAESRYNYQLRVIKDAGGEAAFHAHAGKEGGAWV